MRTDAEPSGVAGPERRLTEREWFNATQADLRLRRYSARTEESYLTWPRKFLAFRRRLPAGTTDLQALRRFLSYLATVRKVSGATQKQALSALRFAFDRGLGVPLPWLEGFSPVHRPPRLPVVLSAREVQAVLRCLSGAKQLVAMLLYGSGLRLLEALSLRVKDVDFERSTMWCVAARATRTARPSSRPRCTRRCTSTSAA